MDPYVVSSHVFTVAAVLLLAGYSVWYTHRQLRSGKPYTLADFVATRGTMPAWRNGFSFLVSSVGAWVVVVPPLYASFAGLLGLSMNALCNSLPILVIAGLAAGPVLRLCRGAVQHECAAHRGVHYLGRTVQ
eukprot:RCo043631